MMLRISSSVPRAAAKRLQNAAPRKRAARAMSSEVDKNPIAEDGRHEVWRDGIYDHDNEPK